MEIRPMIPTSLPANEAAASTTPTPSDPRQNQAPRINPARESQGENREDENRREAEKPKIPIGSGTRIELRVDERTNEVYGQVINRETGEAIREIPAKELRHLDPETLALLGGALVDKTA